MSAAGDYFESRNPAHTDEVIGIFPRSGTYESSDAVLAAKAAYPKWRLVPVPARAAILFKAAELMRTDKEQLTNLMTREMGKNLDESKGDVQEAIDMCEFIAGEGRRFYGVTTTSELPNKHAETRRMPMGVAALITPWNFPIAIPSWKIAPALLCGNTVVFKPAEDTPACAEAFVRILLEAGLDKYPGVLNMVHGYGPEVGEPLVNHPDVALVSFTGSSEVGKMIAMQCASKFKKYSLEMGGKNATIVMDDADLELAVNACWWGAFGTCGQRCTASSRLIVHEKVLDEFTKRFVERTAATRVGNGLEPGIEVGPLINKRALEKIIRYMQIARDEGVHLLCGGEPYSRSERPDLAKGYFFKPTVLSAPDSKMRINQEEMFGPVTAIMPAKDLEDAIRIANGVPYGLSTAIITQNIRNGEIAKRDLESGITYVGSCSTTGAEVHLPFGGTKQTGNGHREGLGALDIFSEQKTIYVDFSGKMQRAQIDNQ
ncbi:MAG: aldehyde dehydrogenase family protein [bacterium]|nr:aldehyde dehydrogenase family protein [bacterium]